MTQILTISYTLGQLQTV